MSREVAIISYKYGLLIYVSSHKISTAKFSPNSHREIEEENEIRTTCIRKFCFDTTVTTQRLHNMIKSE